MNKMRTIAEMQGIINESLSRHGVPLKVGMMSVQEEEDNNLPDGAIKKWSYDRDCFVYHLPDGTTKDAI